MSAQIEKCHHSFSNNDGVSFVIKWPSSITTAEAEDVFACLEITRRRIQRAISNECEHTWAKESGYGDQCTKCGQEGIAK